jgi:hypothetical protein
MEAGTEDSLFVKKSKVFLKIWFLHNHEDIGKTNAHIRFYYCRVRHSRFGNLHDISPQGVQGAGNR